MLDPGTQIGPYEIDGPLGRGGMGEVYCGRDRKLGRPVAIKVLPAEVAGDERRARGLEAEARAASALNHPNIVTIYQVGRTESQFYIAMELVDGATLRDLVSEAPLPTRRVLDIGAQIAEGLAAAHEAGIIHRDLKPENVMIRPDGLVKILDFGVAKLTAGGVGEMNNQAPTLAPRTEPGTILGTVGYMSPEQVSGGAVGLASDQFSFGAILYEMTTARRAFQRPTAVETLAAIVRDGVEPIAVVSPALEAPVRWIIERCLAKSPNERYVSTRDLARDLRNLQQRLPELAAPDVGLARGAAPAARTRHRLVTAGIITMLAAGVGFTSFLLAPASRPALPTFEQLTYRHGAIRGARFAADGRTVVYGAAWSREPADLYATQPGSPESRPLGLGSSDVFSISRGNEMALALGCRLNWGECIGTLARMPLTGGAPRELMESVHGADWGPDGETLAVVHFSRGTYQLQYPAGNILYESPGWMTYPRVSPRGDVVAFLDHPVLGDIGGSVSIIDSRGTRQELSSGWKALQGLAWSDGDELWFTGSRVSKGGSLSLNAVTLSGRERVVFPSPGTIKLYDISRDGERSLLMRGTQRAGIVGLAPGSSSERDLSWFDYSTVADLSRDGNVVLFYELGQGVGGSPTVYLRRTDGSVPVRLGSGRPLALSPDGRWAVAVQQGPPPRLILLPTGPGEERVLPAGVVADYLDWAAWAPDSRRIYFAAEDLERQKRTYVQDIDGGDAQPVTPAGMAGTLLSPDGRLIAAVDRYGEYYLCPTDGSEPEPLEGYIDGDTLLQWSDDGLRLFVRAAGNLQLAIYSLDLRSGRRELWKALVPPDSAGLIDIGSNPGEVRLTPDGTAYAYTYWTSLGELYVAQGLR